MSKNKGNKNKSSQSEVVWTHRAFSAFIITTILLSMLFGMAIYSWAAPPNPGVSPTVLTVPYVNATTEVISDRHVFNASTHQLTVCPSDNSVLFYSIMSGGQWFHYNIRPGINFQDSFVGLHAQKNIIQSSYPYYITHDKGAVFEAVSYSGGGLNITTGKKANDAITLTNGDNKGTVYVWNVTRYGGLNWYERIHFYDITNVYFSVTMYEDTDSWCGIILDTALDNHIRLVTTNDGMTDTSDFGAITTGSHEFIFYLCESSFRASMDDATAVELTTVTALPDGLLTFRFYLETLEDATKTEMLEHIWITMAD